MNLAPAIHHWGNLGVFLVIPLTLEPGPPVCGCCWTCHSCTSAEWHLLDSSSNLWLLWHHWKTRKRWKWAVKVSANAQLSGLSPRAPRALLHGDRRRPRDCGPTALPLTKHQLLNSDDDERMLSVPSLYPQRTNLWLPRGRRGGRRKD